MHKIFKNLTNATNHKNQAGFFIYVFFFNLVVFYNYFITMQSNTSAIKYERKEMIGSYKELVNSVKALVPSYLFICITDLTLHVSG